MVVIVTFMVFTTLTVDLYSCEFPHALPNVSCKRLEHRQLRARAFAVELPWKDVARVVVIDSASVKKWCVGSRQSMRMLSQSMFKQYRNNEDQLLSCLSYRDSDG